MTQKFYWKFLGSDSFFTPILLGIIVLTQIFLDKAWDGNKRITLQLNVILFLSILIFSAMLTSVQFSLKTWPLGDNWPGLELFLMLSRRLKTSKKPKKFLVLVWLRKVSTTSPNVKQVLPMPDAIQQWVSLILCLSNNIVKPNTNSTQLKAALNN